QTAFHFWSHESRLSQSTLGRATKILSQIYCSDDVEEQFLCHANYLLLELSSKNPDFERPLFDKPLKDCQYSNLHIFTTWRRRYASWVSGGVGSQILLAAGTAMGAVQLKSTLVPENAQFTPTQGAYDWMTGSFFNNTYGDLNFSLDENSTLTGIGNVSENLSIKKYRNVTEVKTSFDDVPTSQSIENELKYLRRRILKDKSKTSQVYAKIETKRRGIL
uniref:DNA-dependent protein kinase catalytic subunit CC5 domain-containing protein n=1 Tax=Romanomermis culicivorax TaxID=13658 RepID=A0A915IWL9_ROMCU